MKFDGRPRSLWGSLYPSGDPKMPAACWAPPPSTPRGGRTHQSSSTTRTSTKNVFLLTRFLNVSAKGENFSYVGAG